MNPRTNHVHPHSSRIDGLQRFNELTTFTNSLKTCYDSSVTIDEACTKWYKDFNKLLHQCFKKIRITNTPPKRTVDFEIFKALDDLKALKESMKTASDMCKTTIETEIRMYEKWLAKMQGEKCIRLIEEGSKNLTDDGSFNPNFAWSLKKKIFPNY